MSQKLRELASEPQTNGIGFFSLTKILFRDSGIPKPQIVDKRWGGELIYVNEDYCMKLLLIEAGKKTSMHFHVQKAETLMVIEGVLQIDYITKEGENKTVHLSKYNAFTVNPGLPHQLIALDKDVLLVEASTYDQPEDSVRVKL